MQTFWVSVVAAGPQAYLGYVEQAPLVMHPAPLVVQVDITALQVLSVVKVTGSKAHVNGTHADVEAFQPQVNVVDPVNGVLLHSDAVVNPPHVDGLVLHWLAKSQ